MLPVRKSLASSEKKNNINGSGVGLRHPAGATGARLIVNLLHALKKNNKRLGLATVCGGGGVSLAWLLK